MAQCLLKSENGSSVILTLIFVALIVVTSVSMLALSDNYDAEMVRIKARIGEDSLNIYLNGVFKDETLCSSQLTPGLAFNAALAANPGGNSATVHMPISFKLLTGGQTMGGAANYFSQFSLSVNNIYFANAISDGIEQAWGTPLFNHQVYKGEVWVTTQVDVSNIGSIHDIKVLDNMYIWTNAGVVTACGVVKTPQQFCQDEMGGQGWDTSQNPPCYGMAFPCAQGQYFLGYVAGVASCLNSPANCPIAGQTWVSNGLGGMTCQILP